ncbi:hypothetical protein COEREDRAFT_14199 [Coemansia reversa NRRL 1564]|uniref:Uncharacterized protein n=1 Tax=Coemansia reversa (strain ATCC 12441 / NRRL 1564) TaxID=763665 RepID=A0A2G5BGR2_COERN|nr:hypothetical protein COEREDRAFT_14199 [Coemansia reversa NRRL 1564]|eukprot:PIA18195.1 hypothetical protein COEREDRAFT_14199 [Coemansia reversa NRRL 1564]
MSEVDEEFDRAREKSQGRFRSAFEAIFAKYGHIDEEDDIIDLSTGKLIVDNGRIRNADVIKLGDLLRYSERSSLPSGHVNAGSSPRSSYTARTESNDSLSPKHISNVQPPQRAYTHGSAHSFSSDNDFFNVDFMSLSHRVGSSRLALRKHANEVSSAEDEGAQYDYDSSDSMEPGQDTLDAYFTSSIEQYLDKLRQQLSGPPPIENGYSFSSNSESGERDVFLRTLNEKQPSGTMRPFHLPSSPHSVSSQYSDDHYSFRRQRRHANTNSRLHRISAYGDADEHDYVSESASQTSELDKENPQPTTVHTKNNAYEDQHSIGKVESGIFQSTKLHYHGGLYVRDSSAYELDDEVISEEEPIEASGIHRLNAEYDLQTNTFSSTSLSRKLSREGMQEVIRRPIPVAHLFHESAYDNSSRNLQHNNGEYCKYGSTEPVANNASVLYSQRPSPAPDDKTRVYFAAPKGLSQINTPVIRKPQPVAPHVFFECDSVPSGNDDNIHGRYAISSNTSSRNGIYDDNKNNNHNTHDYINNKIVDDDASIHSDDSLHSLSPTPEQQYFDETKGTNNIYDTANSYSVYDMQIVEGSKYLDRAN